MEKERRCRWESLPVEIQDVILKMVVWQEQRWYSLLFVEPGVIGSPSGAALGLLAKEVRGRPTPRH